MTRSSEFEIIATLFAPLAQASPGARNLTDDVAVVTPTPGQDIVLTTDTLIAGVHFLADDPPDQIAQKALRVNLSDLAAKGARPVGILQALALGADSTQAFLESYARGLGSDLRHFNVPLLGGDTTSMPSGAPLVITITALGEVPHNTAPARGGAQVGDLLCVSGTLGDAALGLRALRGALPPHDAEHHAALVRRYRIPEPRLALGQAIRGIATACLDISDGLCADVGHICAASNVTAEIALHMLPVSAAAQRRIADDPSLMALVLGGGDDYELAFTIPPSARGQLADIAASTGTPVAIIGHMAERTDGVMVKVIGDNGQEVAVPSAGYVHR